MGNPVLEFPALGRADDRAVGAVGAGVQQDLGVKGMEPPVLLDAASQPADRAMADGRGQHFLLAGVDDLDRPVDPFRKQGAHMLVVELLPAAEASAHGRLDDADPAFRQVEKLT